MGVKYADAYKHGAQLATVTLLEKWAQEPPQEAPVPKQPQEHSGMPWWTIPAAGLAAGLGAYGLARTPMLASAKKWPVLRKIQEMAGGRMLRHGIGEAPEVTPKGWEKLKRSILYGPEVFGEKVPATVKGTERAPAAVFSGYWKKPPKGTFDPSLGPVTGREAGKMFRKAERLEDKLLQARFLGKHAPGVMPETLGLKDILRKYNLPLRPGKHLAEDLFNLQKALKKEFGGRDYIIKPRAERPGFEWSAGSKGQFPTGKQNLFKLYQRWKEIRSPYRRLFREDPDVAFETYVKHKGYKGRVVDEMLHNNVVFQKKVDIPQFKGRMAERLRASDFPTSKEVRVHVVGGKAIPMMSAPRYGGLSLQVIPEQIRAWHAARWVQKNVINKLPKKYHNLTYGFDIAPVKGGGYKIIEMNPGGQSGFLDFPIVGNLPLYRAVTGRHTRPASALLGLGAGGAGAGAAGAAT